MNEISIEPGNVVFRLVKLTGGKKKKQSPVSEIQPY
jgi:hypothetical protein